jgi:hypothetical protein
MFRLLFASFGVSLLLRESYGEHLRSKHAQGTLAAAFSERRSCTTASAPPSLKAEAKAFLVLQDDPNLDNCKVKWRGRTMAYDNGKANGLFFIDAFMASGETHANVVFNTKLLPGTDTFDHAPDWKRAHGDAPPVDYQQVVNGPWTCHWFEPGANAGLSHQVRGTAESDGHKHSLVVKCPVVSSCNTLWLNVTGSWAGADQIVLQNIHVCNQPLFEKPMSTAVCTGMAPRDQDMDMVVPWVHYQLETLKVGQVVIYFDGAENKFDPKRDALKQFTDNNRLVIIPIDFWTWPNDRVRWGVNQQAYETHCLYSAKSKVKWVGNWEVDEFPDMREKFPTLEAFVLQDKFDQKKVNGINLLMQYWYVPKGEKYDPGHFPCQAKCKAEGFRGNQKLLLNPELVIYKSVHEVTAAVEGSVTVKADTSTEVRLDHLRFPMTAEEDCSFDIAFGSGWNDGSFMHFMNKHCSSDGSFVALG